MMTWPLQDGPDENKTASHARKKRSEAPNKKQCWISCSNCRNSLRKIACNQCDNWAYVSPCRSAQSGELSIKTCDTSRTPSESVTFWQRPWRLSEWLLGDEPAEFAEAWGHGPNQDLQRSKEIHGGLQDQQTKHQVPQLVPGWSSHRHEDQVLVIPSSGVLGIVTSSGDIMPAHFFSYKEKVNTEVNIKALKEVVKPWVEEVTAGVSYVFQQDSAPTHAAKNSGNGAKETST